MARHRSISDEIIAGITAALAERAKSGTNRPTTTAIATQFGVSRTFVRQVASGERRPDDDRPGDSGEEITVRGDIGAASRHG
jgi:hypothetical protein